MTEQTGYNATLDPRTGRPVLPLDAENARKAEVESAPLTDEDNQGIDIGEENEPDIEEPDEVSEIEEEEEERPRPLRTEEEGAEAPSAEEINRITPRMKGPDIEREGSDEDLIDRNV
jgi:hypothetical protein